MADNTAIIQEINLLVRQDPQTQPEIQKLVDKLTTIVKELEKSGLSAGKFSKMLSDWDGKLQVFKTSLIETKKHYEQWAKEIDASNKEEARQRSLMYLERKHELDVLGKKQLEINQMFTKREEGVVAKDSSAQIEIAKKLQQHADALALTKEKQAAKDQII